VRSSEQIGRTVEQWHAFQRAERERHLVEFLAECAEARAAGAEWIRWIDEGCPRLTPEEYERRTGARAPAGRGRRQPTLADSAHASRSRTQPATPPLAAASSADPSQLGLL
jgi:hypothetical protein